jgi:hypothetical protein
MSLRLTDRKTFNLFEAARILVAEHDLRLSIQAHRLSLQDSWYLMYLLVDTLQDNAPITRQRYYTPRVMNVVDTARRVLTRNPLKYHVVARHFSADDREAKEPLRVFENVLHGVQSDIDRQLVARGQLRARQQAAFHGLVRGAWAYKLHLTKEAKTSTGSPIFYEQYDPRLTLPNFDNRGVSDVIAWNIVTLNQMLPLYEDKLRPIVDKVLKEVRRIHVGSRHTVDMAFMHSALTLREWSTRDEHGLLLDLAGLPDQARRSLFRDEEAEDRFIWLKEPTATGLDWSLIQVGNVNGIPAGLVAKENTPLFQASPLNKLPLHQGGDQTTGHVNAGLWIPPGSTSFSNQASGTVDPAGALAGRSIFAGVAHLIPEMNSMMAMLKDAVKQNVRGTWVFRSRDGTLQNIKIGDGVINPITLQENLERVRADINTPDALGLLQIVNQEIADGSLDLRFILASESEGSGFLRARLEQAALTALSDYKEGVQDYGNSVAESFIRQYRKAEGLGGFTLAGRQPGAMTNFFVVDIDDQVKKLLKEGKEPPIIETVVKASMPVDMMARINMAKSAIDPNNPIMSLAQALDMIMEIDDAEAAYDMITSDIGNRHPTIQLLRIAEEFKENGAPEIAQMILTQEFQAAFTQASQQGQTSTQSGASPGINPSTTPPEVTSGGGTEPSPGAPVQ